MGLHKLFTNLIDESLLRGEGIRLAPFCHFPANASYRGPKTRPWWGILVKSVTKVSTLSQNLLCLDLLRETLLPRQGRTPLCETPSQPLKFPSVALRHDGDRKAEVTGVGLR